MERIRTRRRRRKGRGKAKGGAFERKIAKQLSLWITNGEKEDCLWRSSISGGRATVAHRKGKLVRQAGDLTAVSPEGHALTDRWYIECKNVKDIQLLKFLVKGFGLLARFWNKCQQEASRYNRDPVIIFKQNGWPVLLMARRDVFVDLKLPSIIGGRKADISIGLLDTIVRESWLP